MSIRPSMAIAATALAAMIASPAWPRPEVAGNRCGAVYGSALRARAEADTTISHGDYRTANRRLDGGLETLGTAYLTDDMTDDTGMHLALARSQESKGRFRQAAASKRAILTERLQLCSR